MIERIKALMKNHDWFFDYSDDQRDWRNGMAEKERKNPNSHAPDPHVRSTRTSGTCTRETQRPVVHRASTSSRAHA